MRILNYIFCVLFILTISSVNAFTYQGELSQAGNLYTGNADLKFKLFDAQTNGAMVGLEDLQNSVSIENGRFVVELNQWIGEFDGGDYWLEISAAIPAGNTSFTTLSPRQKINPVPYAEYAYDLDVTGLQLRVNGSCGANSAISLINQDGSVSCSSFATSNQACSIGQVVTGIAANGIVTCATDVVGLTVVTGNEITDGSVEDIDLAGSIAANKISGTAAVLAFSGTQSFDTDLLTLDATNNQVGINNPTPNYDLDIDGTLHNTEDMITDGDYTYSSPKAYYHFTHPLEFRAAFNSSSDDYGVYDLNGAYGFTKKTGNTYIMASIHLPDLATITETTCYWYDTAAAPNDFTSMSFNLFRGANGTTISSTMAFASELPANMAGHDNNDVENFTDTTISSAVVDNSNYSYFYKFTMNSNDATPCTTSCSQRFYGCKTSYTMSQVAP